MRGPTAPGADVRRRRACGVSKLRIKPQRRTIPHPDRRKAVTTPACERLVKERDVPASVSCPTLEPRDRCSDQRVGDQRGGGHGAVRWRWRAKSHTRLHQQDRHAKGWHRVAGTTGQRPRCRQVDRHCPEEQDPLHDKRDVRVVPQSQAHLRRVIVERQIRPVNDQIERPVGKDCCADQRSTPSRARDQTPDNCRSYSPAQGAGKTVGVRHVIKVQCVRLREPGNDPDTFNPKEDEDRPEHVEELDSYEESPQRNLWGERFARKLGP